MSSKRARGARDFRLPRFHGFAESAAAQPQLSWLQHATLHTRQCAFASTNYLCSISALRLMFVVIISCAAYYGTQFLATLTSTIDSWPAKRNLTRARSVLHIEYSRGIVLYCAEAPNPADDLEVRSETTSCIPTKASYERTGYGDFSSCNIMGSRSTRLLIEGFLHS
jgi:hypothetical protein